ncbi:MAG: hypothetical protein ACRD1H_08015 [Vicinamibacterales bacterium]
MPASCRTLALYIAAAVAYIVLGVFVPEVRDRYAELKRASADRCARLLGNHIKPAEIQFHHEVTNQYLWNQF